MRTMACPSLASNVSNHIAAASACGSNNTAGNSHTADDTSTCIRRIVEFCCGPQSLIGQYASANCEVIRLTAADDMASQSGVDTAVSAVSVPGLPTLLFGSLPCVGGSPYQRLNWYAGPATRTKIQNHWKLFRVLWRNFVVVADACVANGGRIALEWPRDCSYWRDRRVQAALKRWGCTPYRMDGCMFGLRSTAAATRGMLLRKPWIISSNCDQFWRIAYTCVHSRDVHTRIQGSDTKRTENYTEELADGIHFIWYHHVYGMYHTTNTTTTHSSTRNDALTADVSS